jgi:hypothetical protein
MLLARVCGFGAVFHRVPVTPGRSVLEELHARAATAPRATQRLRARLLYALGLAYKYYVDRQMEVGSRTNEDFQRRYWSTYTEYYATKAREDYDTDYYRTFDALFARAVSDREARVCLDIGCGGFNQILRLRARFPRLSFVGNDISAYAAEAWSRLGDRRGIRFVPGSILARPDTFDDVDVFYTFGVLMFLTEAELRQLFARLQRSPRPIAGVIVEIHQEGPVASVPRARHFVHDYGAYLREYGFEILGLERREHYAMPGERVLFAYFVTRPSAAPVAAAAAHREAP